MKSKDDEIAALRAQVAVLEKQITDALRWVEKATVEDEGHDWDDVFMARDVLRTPYIMKLAIESFGETDKAKEGSQENP